MARKSASPEKKFWTLAEANAALPLVRAIIADITALYSGLRDRGERLRRIVPANPDMIDRAHMEEINDLQADIERDEQQLTEYVHELNKLGVELKDPIMGLVDFPCWMDNRPVYLCWRMGEPEVGFWHEIDAGFKGRQKIQESGVGV